VLGLEPLGEDVLFDRSRDLAVGGSYVYWATEQQIFRCPIANCMAEGPTLLVTADAEISALKVDGSAMYWLEASALHSCPLTGCEHSSVVIPTVAGAFHLYESARYAMDGSDLYWVDPKTPPGESFGWGGPVRKMPK